MTIEKKELSDLENRIEERKNDESDPIIDARTLADEILIFSKTLEIGEKEKRYLEHTISKIKKDPVVFGNYFEYLGNICPLLEISLVKR